MPEIVLPLNPAVGTLCGVQTAWGRLRITTRARVMFNLQGSAMRLEVSDPNGARVFELSGDRLCAELEMEPGLWTLAAKPTNPSAGDYSFELWVEINSGVGPS